MKTVMDNIWEIVDNTEGEDYTERMKVVGGWLVRTQVSSPRDVGFHNALALCFVPDPAHTWRLS